MWKTLKMWKKNVIKHKNINCRLLLEERLFLVHPVLRNTLLEVRKKTCDMQENVRILTLESRSGADSDSTFDLAKF